MKLIAAKLLNESISFDVELVLDGGTCESSSITVKCGDKYSFPDVSKSECTLDGWFTDPEFANEITEDSYVDFNIRKIYVRWKELDMTNCSSFEVQTTSSYKEFGFYSITLKDQSKPLYIDWGDGTIEEFTDSTYITYFSQEYHTYSDVGTFTVRVSDNATAICCSDSGYSSIYNKIRYTLKKVLTFSTSITSLPSNCFYYAAALTDIQADFSNITSIGQKAFQYCTGLNDFSFMKNATKCSAIPDYCFSNTNFADLSQLPSNFTSFGYSAFGYCKISDLSRIRATDSLGTYCFQYNYSLRSLETLPPRKSLPQYCFYYCTYLQTADFSKFTELTSIPSYCFYYCQSMTSFTAPNVTTSITYNSQCFAHTKISDLSFVKTNDVLNSYCFAYMNSLNNIETLKPRSSLPADCFYQCSYLTCADMSEWTSLTYLPTYAFGYDYRLQQFIAPSSLTGINNYVFYYTANTVCNLSVDLSRCSNLTAIGNYSFYYASGLKHIDLPENIKYIGQYAFHQCRYLTEICLPSSLTAMDIYALSYCTNLTSISSLAENAPTVQSTTFGYSTSYYTGRSKYSYGTNTLYVTNPANYNTSYWSSVLLDSSKCGFHSVSLDEYDIKYGKIIGLDARYLATGSEITPDISVYSSSGALLQNGVDYSLEYENNVDVGTAQLSAVGIGQYKNALTASFRIVADMSELIELEYIQFTGQQYINTGVNPTNHYTEIKYYVGSFVNDSHILGTSSGSAYYHWTEYANKYYWGRNGAEASGGSWTSGQHVLQMNYSSNYQVLLDETLLGSGYQIYSSTSLFIGRRESAINFQGYVYYCRIYDKSTNSLVMDLIPAKDENDVVCMYDNVTKTYFYNQGSGSFTPGPVI